MKLRSLTSALFVLVITTMPAWAQSDIGSYNYEVVPALAVDEPVGVAFHPDGTYALVISHTNTVHAVKWNTGAVTSYNLTPLSGTVYFDDMNFSPDGSYAVLVGYQVDTATEGVVYKFDDTAYRTEQPEAEIVFECTAARRTDIFCGVEFPWEGGQPIVLGRSADNLVASLRRFDPVTEDFTSFLTATNTIAGAMDLAYVNNEFGEPGILVVCGINGTAAYYRTSVGGVWEWRPNSAVGGMGNLSSVAARPGGDYALVIDFSGRRVHRFEAGMFVNVTESPHFPTQGVWNIGFQDDGVRAMVVGRASVSPLRGTAIEYRHDLFSATDMTDVSIPGFDQPPYNASSNTYVEAVDFHPRCDGGLMVARETSLFSDVSLLIRFENELGVSCDFVAAVPLKSQALLWPAVPNPFNPRTTIAFDISRPTAVSLRVFDISGRLVRELVGGEEYSAGRHEVDWHGRDESGRRAGSGTYFYRLEAGDYSETKRMTLVK